MVGPDDGLLIPAFKTPGGTPCKWKEIAPFVWREFGGKQRLAAKVVDGEIQSFSIDSGSPAVVLQPTPWHASAAWLNPAMTFAAIVLLLTALSWHAGAIARRLYRVPLALTGVARLRYHLVRGCAVLALLVYAGWITVFSAMGQGFAAINGKFDWLIVLLLTAGMTGFLGMLALAFWSAWGAWTGARSWASRLWSIPLVIAAGIALWAAAAFGVLDYGLNY